MCRHITREDHRKEEPRESHHPPHACGLVHRSRPAGENWRLRIKRLLVNVIVADRIENAPPPKQEQSCRWPQQTRGETTIIFGFARKPPQELPAQPETAGGEKRHIQYVHSPRRR